MEIQVWQPPKKKVSLKKEYGKAFYKMQTHMKR